MKIRKKQTFIFARNAKTKKKKEENVKATVE